MFKSKNVIGTFASARTSNPDISAVVVQWTGNTLGSCASDGWRPQTRLGSRDCNKTELISVGFQRAILSENIAKKTESKTGSLTRVNVHAE